VAEWFRSLTYRPATSAVVPWVIHRAYLGDFGPIFDGILSSAPAADRDLSFGVFFSIACADDVAFIREQDVRPESRGTLLADYRVRQQQAACSGWPQASPREGLRSPLRTTVPTMLVTGDQDGASPLWMTDHAAPGFINRVEVVLRGKGHTDLDECIPPLYEQFVRTADARRVEASSCRPVPRPPFKTR
jgi:pimeloyl-ACP methyl ester carboxylesterase